MAQAFEPGDPSEVRNDDARRARLTLWRRGFG